MLIAEISADSDTGKFIKLGDITETLEFINSGAISSIKSSTYDKLKSEISNGGLDEYSLNINGNIYANEKANNICNQFDNLFYEVSSIGEEINNIAEKHREDEYKTYIDKLTKKIDYYDGEIQKVIIKINNDVNSVNSFFAGYYADKFNLEKAREKYQEKLDKALVESGKNS